MKTPAAPLDVTEAFPELAGRERRAIRLHPRQAHDPGLGASKMGGTFLWPQEEPWPRCPEVEYLPHDVWFEHSRQLRPGEYMGGEEEVPVGAALHNDYLVGVIQLRRDEVPALGLFPGTDLFQLLWCPRSHLDQYAPYCRVYWRAISEVARPRAAAPPPGRPAEDMIPAVCVFSPEPVIEYPHAWELPEELQERITAWEESPAARGHSYQYELSVAPGTKVGGHVGWNGPVRPPSCPGCGTTMEHLLTVASSERGGTPEADARWLPADDPPAAHPTIMLGDAAPLTVFICRHCGGWPIGWVLQEG